LFETMVDDEDDKLIISIDQESGNTLISGVDKNSLNNPNGATITQGKPKDITVWAQEHKEKGKGHYFETNEAFTHGDLTKIKTLITDLAGYTPGPNAKGGDYTKNALLNSDGFLDKTKTLEYLRGTGTDKTGKQLVAGNYQGDESKWKAVGIDKVGKAGEEAYLNYVIDQGWNLWANER